MFSPEQYITDFNNCWIVEDNGNPIWTRAENKMFENALALYDQDTPDRWKKVASMIPGKTIGDVVRQYQQLEDDIYNIESGFVSVPDDYYHTTNPSCSSSSSFSLDCLANLSSDYDPWYEFHRKRASSSMKASSENEKKKGVPWTEEEHKLFLMGLKKHGKGDWRNISRNFVVTRTPTQVASHAQKYFIRQLSGIGKDKRRSSIHDITTMNLADTSKARPSKNKTKKSSTSCSSSSSKSPPEKQMNLMMMMEMPSSQLYSPSQQQEQEQQQQQNDYADTQIQWIQQQQEEEQQQLQQQQTMADVVSSDPVFDDELFMSDFYGIGDDLSSSYGNNGCDDLSSFDFSIEDQDLFSSSHVYHHESSSDLYHHESPSYLEPFTQNMVFPMPWD